MRTAFTALVGARHPIAGFNRSPGVVAAAEITRQMVAECEQRIAELRALL